MDSPFWKSQSQHSAISAFSRSSINSFLMNASLLRFSSKTSGISLGWKMRTTLSSRMLRRISFVVPSTGREFQLEGL